MRILNFKFLALILSILFLPTRTCAPQQKGTIRGVVVDEANTPVSDAMVNASPLGGWRLVRAVRYVTTDSQGQFLIDGLEFGRYGVFAKKEEAFYPNMSSSFYSDNVFPSATITTTAPVAEVHIRLGPKAALLAGSILNASNGGPVNAALKLTRAATPNQWLSTSVPPNYKVLVPSSTDVLVEVSATGFRTWHPPGPLHLQPGAEQRLDISLEPSGDPGLHPSRFLVPSGFVGWVLLDYQVKDAAPAPTEGDVKLFKFSPNGRLATSSPGPDRGAADQFFYYSPDGSLAEIPTDYRNGNGLIWGEHQGTRDGLLAQLGFFVGTEQQFKKYQMLETHPGPIPEQPGRAPN
jgi:hypothetical protein